MRSVRDVRIVQAVLLDGPDKGVERSNDPNGSNDSPPSDRLTTATEDGNGQTDASAKHQQRAGLGHARQRELVLAARQIEPGCLAGLVRTIGAVEGQQIVLRLVLDVAVGNDLQGTGRQVV